MKLRWLGVAGYEVVTETGTTLLVDPWLTHHFNAPISVSDIKKADAVLLTHAHYDHAADVPEIMERTGAVLLASQEEIEGINRIMRLPKDQLRPVKWDDTVEVEGCSIYVTKAKHFTAAQLALVYLGRPVAPSPNGTVDLSTEWSKDITSTLEGESTWNEVIRTEGLLPKGFHITTENGLRIWHLGSCAPLPIPELATYSSKLRPQIAVVQVNANFEASVGFETVKKIFQKGVGPRVILPHHHDKVYEDQPTVTDVGLFARLVKERFPELNVLNPELGRYYQFELHYR